jgi:prepilin-type N-terminal cleavage/methylation domain-containing protein
MLRRLVRGREGFTFVEVLIALLVLAIISAAFMAALDTSSKSAQLSDVRTSAESLARTEMEYVKNSNYVPAFWDYTLPGGHPSWDGAHTLPDGYNGYTVHVAAQPLRPVDDYIQMVTVTVSFGGKVVYTLQTYKAAR